MVCEPQAAPNPQHTHILSLPCGHHVQELSFRLHGLGRPVKVCVRACVFSSSTFLPLKVYVAHLCTVGLAVMLAPRSASAIVSLPPSDLELFLDTNGYSKASVVGHSLGAGLATCACARVRVCGVCERFPLATPLHP